MVLQAGSGLGESELRAILTQRLSDYKVPKYIVFLDELPKTVTGKVRPADLARLAQARLKLS